MKHLSARSWLAIGLVLLSSALSTGPAPAFEIDLKLTPSTEALERVLTNASLAHAVKRDGTTAPQDILAAAQADYGRLVGALYERGYYGPVISIRVDGREAANIPPLSTLARVSRVDLVVSTGPIFRLGVAEIAPLTTATHIPDTFRSGAPAETPVIRDAARAGVDGWRAAGHAKAQIDWQEITADHNQARLDVRLRVAPGPRVQFGDLNIAGTSAVRDQRIREIADIPSGAVFDPTVLARSRVRLRRSGAFNLVTLREAEALSAGDVMDIDLTLVDARPRRFGLGAELHSTEGLTLSGFWLHRNLWGGAERLRIEGEVSGLGGERGGLNFRLSVGLLRPSTFNADSDFYVRGEFEQLDEPLYLSRQASAEFGIQRYYSETQTAEAGVAYRFSDVQDDLGARQFSHLMLPLAVTWDRRDDILNPTKGTFLRSEAMPFIGLGKSASGARGYVDARAYHSVGAKDGITFAGRLQLGTVVGAPIAGTPPDWLFLSGGSGTVRGHSYQSLSILSGAAETGGRSFIGIAGEIRLRVSQKIAAVGFYDAGYIGANSWIDSTGGWHSGAGLGLRYHSGIGPIRLDVAVPVTGSDTSGFQVYVGIGQAF